jgi:hypothetical protein
LQHKNAYRIAHSITPKCFSHFKFIKTLAVQIIQVADYQKINSIKCTFKKIKEMNLTQKQ